MTTIYLSQSEVEGVTGKKRFSAQARALAKMGIECRVRPDGSPLVSRLAYERAMGGVSKRSKDKEPDFQALLHGT